MKRFYAFLLAFGVLFTALPSCEQWESDGTVSAVQEVKKNVSMSPVTAGDYGGSLPVSSILCPDAGEDVKAEDIRSPVAALLAEADDIRNNAVTGLANKVDRDGDTMTDTLNVNALTLNNEGVVATGNGSGFGLKGIGGSSGGGGRFEGTGNGSMGVSAVGGPAAGTGIVASGGVGGLAAELYPGTTSTAAAPQMGVYQEGYLVLASPNPNAGVDPGADGAVFAGSVARARGRIFLGGAPPYSFIGKKPLNFVALATVVGLGTTRVTMVRPMADLNYEVQLTVNGAIGYAVSETNIAGRTTTQFEFTVFSTTTGTPGVGSAEYVDIAVFGEQ